MDRKKWKKLLPALEDVWLPYLKYDDKLNVELPQNPKSSLFLIVVSLKNLPL